MSGSNDFTVRLHERLAAAEAARADRLQDNECRMRERDAQLERFGQGASALHRAVVRPLVEELAAHFENATTEHYQTPLGISSACRFAATDRFPASARLLIGVNQDDPTGLRLTYDLEIIPLLFTYEKTDSYPIDVSRPDHAALRDRLAAWLLRFTESYLQLETDSRYQDWRSHTDPVCAMRISGGTTARTLEHGGRRYYFCSEVCQQKFEAEPALYAGGHGVLAGPGAQSG